MTDLRQALIDAVFPFTGHGNRDDQRAADAVMHVIGDRLDRHEEAIRRLANLAMLSERDQADVESVLTGKSADLPDRTDGG